MAHLKKLIAPALGLAAFCAASHAAAQALPRTAEFSELLPSIPLTSPVSAQQLALQAIPGLGRSGIPIAPGVLVDRLVRPKCMFVANQNNGSGSVRQSADIGRVIMYCP